MTTKEWVSNQDVQDGNVYEGQMVSGPDGGKISEGYGTITFKDDAGTDSGEWIQGKLTGLARSRRPT